MPNLSLKHWLAVGGVGLGLLIVMVILAKAKPSTARAQVEVPAQTTGSKDVGNVAELINSMGKTIESSKQEYAAKNSTHVEPPPLPQNPMQQAQSQMQTQQMQQVLAQQAYLRSIESSRRYEGNAPVSRIAPEGGEKSFVLSFKDETHETPNVPSSAVAVDTAKPAKGDDSGAFACGSESDYWSACIPEGSVLQAVTTNELRGDFTGPVMATVSQPFMSKDKKNVLVSSGTVVLGESGRVGGQDQARLAIGFHRLILSEGSAFHHAGWSKSLDKFQGLSVDGSAGQEGHVNHHWGSTIAASAAYGLLAGFALSGTGSVLTNDGIGVYRQGVSQSMGQQGEQALSRMWNRMPTISVPVGSECDVYIATDLRMKQ